MELESTLINDPFNLSQIYDEAVKLDRIKSNEAELFTEVQGISLETLQTLYEKYKNNSGPVNTLRFRVLKELVAGGKISGTFLDNGIAEIESKSGKRSFKSYTHFAILFPLFQEEFKIDVKGSLNEFSAKIATDLNIQERVKIHSVDFLGSRGFGDDRAWTAIFNNSHKNQRTAVQMFINISAAGLWCGIYDRLNGDFRDSLEFSIDENTVQSVISYFDGYKDDILKDQFITEKYAQIGVEGASLYKVSFSPDDFIHEEVQACIDNNIVVVRERVELKGNANADYQTFSSAKAGDLFYCCWGNEQCLFVGQFVNDEIDPYSLAVDSKGLMERKYRLLVQVQVAEPYGGKQIKWVPSSASSCVEIPSTDYELFNESILRPFFQAELNENEITKLPEPRLNAASLKPVEITDADVIPQLDVEILAKEFAGIIQNLKTEKGQMLGVFGSWGRGKTYFIDQAFEVLIPKDEEGKPPSKFKEIRFNAWKYQDTESVWAYLYGNFLDEYLKQKKSKWGKFWLKLNLNNTRKGKWKLISVLALLIAPVIWYQIDACLKAGQGGGNPSVLLSIYSVIGVIALSKGYTIYKKLYPSIKDIVKEYSKAPSFKSVLGLQAEIQDELKTLIKVWFNGSSKPSYEKIVLFVDDIDRCSENNIIQVVDALRVMLDDTELIERIIVVAAIDEMILETAIKWKYGNYLKIDHNDMPKDLIREYMDKLFITGIKLPRLKEQERSVILRNYATSSKILQELKSVKNEVEPENVTVKIETEDAAGSQNATEFEFPDTVYVADFEEQDEYFLLVKELTELQEASTKILGNATPRQLRIFIYRYLLAKNIASSYLAKVTRTNILVDDYWKFLIVCIAKKTVDTEWAVELSEYKGESINKRLLEFTPKLIDIVVPY